MVLSVGERKMTRTFKEIEIEGRKAYVLFDTSSTRSYVRREFASKVRWKTVPFRVGLGGRIYGINGASALNCAIEGGYPLTLKPIQLKN